MKLKTTELTALVSKAFAGASNNKMLPITNLMCIRAKDNTLTIETTDSVNYLYVSQTINDSENFYAVVNAEMFTKLISKLTCDEVTLLSSDGVLEVIGNGRYKIAMQLDENSEIIKYPDPMNTNPIPINRDTTVAVNDVKTAYNRCSNSLSTEISDVPIDEFYFSDRVITTDSVRLSSISNNVFDREVVLNSRFVELLCQSPEPELDVRYLVNGILVSSAVYSIYCNKLADVSKYPNVTGLLEDALKFEGKCVVSKIALVSILDRLSLFISPLSQNRVHLSFEPNHITLSNDNSSSVEQLTYISSESFTPFECDLDVELLTAQIKSMPEDETTLYYANDTAIKMTQSNVTQILCLSE